MCTQVLYIGKGCPSDATSFQCTYGNDDSCGLQSNIVLTNWVDRYAYVMATGYSSAGSMYVNIQYTLPSPTSSLTRTPSGTGTASISQGASPTQTSTGTPSASLTNTPTPSVDYTVDPSDSPSYTPSVSSTASFTASLTRGATGSSTNTATNSLVSLFHRKTNTEVVV